MNRSISLVQALTDNFSTHCKPARFECIHRVRFQTINNEMANLITILFKLHSMRLKYDVYSKIGPKIKCQSLAAYERVPMSGKPES